VLLRTNDTNAMTIGEYATVQLDFMPIRPGEGKMLWQHMQDGKHIGRLIDGMETKWHVFRHSDGILVCWQCLAEYADHGEPMRIVTNTTDVNELWKYLPA
jgi:hypothetical protein